MELRWIEEQLAAYVRPRTFPVAVRLLRSEDELPPNVRMPRSSFGHSMALCQVIAFARRFGWVVGMGAGDSACPAGALTLGFCPVTEAVLDGRFDMPFWGEQSTRAEIVRNVPKLDFGSYRYLLAAPLARADFAPQLILIYGDGAQMSRLIQANTFVTGKPLASAGLGAFACSAEITGPLLSGDCHVTIPGGGERTLAHTQDHELCFTLPIGRAEAILAGLKETHKKGSRFPIPSYLDYEPQFPPGYGALMDHLRAAADVG